MSRLAVHIEHYKKGAVGSLASHNWYKRGERDQHSNQDIDTARSKDNMALILPEEDSLYRSVKASVEKSTGRVTAASVWVSEWCVYPPEELQNPLTADKDKIKAYFNDVLDWMKANNYDVRLAVVHMDETTVHMQADTIPLTREGKLSRKEVYTRANLNSIHTDLAQHLANKGWDIQRGESTKDKQVRSVSVPEYKKQAEARKQELLSEIETIREDLSALQTPEEVRNIEAEPTVFGGKVKIPQEQWEVAERWINAAAVAIEYGDQARADLDEARAAEAAANAAAEQLRKEQYEESVLRAELKQEISQLQHDLRLAKLQNKELKERLEKMNQVAAGEAGLASKLIRLLPSALSDKAALALVNKATGLNLESMAKVDQYRKEAESKLQREILISEQLLDAKRYLKRQEKTLG